MKDTRTVVYCTVLFCTVLFCTVLYCTVLYCTGLYWTGLDWTGLYYTVLYCTVLYCTVLHCTVLVLVSLLSFVFRLNSTFITAPDFILSLPNLPLYSTSCLQTIQLNSIQFRYNLFKKNVTQHIV